MLATVWLQLEDIVLSALNQAQKNQQVGYNTVCVRNLKKTKLLETRQNGKQSFNYLFPRFLLLFVREHAGATMCAWGLEDKLWDFVLSFNHECRTSDSGFVASSFTY